MNESVNTTVIATAPAATDVACCARNVAVDKAVS